MADLQGLKIILLWVGVILMASYVSAFNSTSSTLPSVTISYATNISTLHKMTTDDLQYDLHHTNSTVTPTTKALPSAECSYTITPIKFGFQINIRNSTTDKYILNLKEKGQQSESIQERFSRRSHEIKHLKPCTEYEHHVAILDGVGQETACKGPENTTTWTQGINFLNSSEIIQNVPTGLPVVIDPDLPPHCTNLTIDYTCQEDGDLDMKKVSELEPFTDYSCTGHIKDNNVTKKNTTALKFRVDCDLEIKAKYPTPKTNTSIELSWTTTSQKCNSVLGGLKKLSYDCSCVPLSSSHKHSVSAFKDPSQGACKIAGLEPFTDYECEVQPKYNNNSIVPHQRAKVEVKTQPGTPEDIGNVIVTLLENNVIRVNCSYRKRFHGPERKFIALLHNDFTTKLVDKTCDFIFKDLRYLTEYKLEVTAFNGIFQSAPQTLSVSTSYNDKALIGLMIFLIILLLSVPLAVLIYKIYVRRRRRHVMHEPTAIYVNVAHRRH